MYLILGALGILVVLVIGILVFGEGSSNAAGYTREHGHCPNMGACKGCNVCEGD